MKENEIQSQMCLLTGTGMVLTGKKRALFLHEMISLLF